MSGERLVMQSAGEPLAPPPPGRRRVLKADGTVTNPSYPTIVPPPPAVLAPPPVIAPPAQGQKSRRPVVIGLLAAIVIIGGLTAALAPHDSASTSHLAATALAGISVESSTVASTTLPPAVPPPVPDGYTLYQGVGYQVALPSDWISVDVSGDIHGAFAAAEQAHPDRAQTLKNIEGTFTNEVLISVGPPLGALVTDLQVRQTGPLHGITGAGFIDSFRQSVESDHTADPVSDFVATPSIVAGRPALRVSFHHTQTLSNGATDEAYTFTMIVEGTTSDISLTLNTDNPDRTETFFDTASTTLVATG